MDCSLPGSSVHGIFQRRILENVPGDQAQTQDFVNVITLELEVMQTAGFKSVLNWKTGQLDSSTGRSLVLLARAGTAGHGNKRLIAVFWEDVGGKVWRLHTATFAELC